MMRSSPKKENIVVFYHDDHDGFGAAWAAWKQFGSRAIYKSLDHPVSFTQVKPYITKQSDVYFLDICPDETVLTRVKRVVHRVVIIDHHASRKDLVCSQKEFVFDTKHSCAFLAWKYFQPNKKLPLIIKYVQDLDLWQWKLPGTEALFAALSWRFDFSYWNKLTRIIDNARLRARYIKTGNIMLQYKKQIVDDIVREAEEVRLGKIKALAVNAQSLIHSEVGNALARYRKGIHVGIPFRIMNHGKSAYISLRSDGTIDVSKIAAKYGGGGHKVAAGFVWPLRMKLPFRFVQHG